MTEFIFCAAQCAEKNMIAEVAKIDESAKTAD
jgi:hypothetical protein